MNDYRNEALTAGDTIFWKGRMYLVTAATWDTIENRPAWKVNLKLIEGDCLIGKPLVVYQEGSGGNKHLPSELSGYAVLSRNNLADVLEARENGDIRLRDLPEVRLKHALAALRHIARTCIEDPDVAQFACRAAEDPPSAFAPEEDY